MARPGATFGLDGKALHIRLAARVAARPRTHFGPETRALGSIAALAVGVPLAALALANGLGPASTLGLIALTLSLASVVGRMLADELGIDPRARRERRAATPARILPAMHRATPAHARVQVFAPRPHRS